MTEPLSDPLLISPARMKSEPVERPQSPEANCAICLEEFNNKSYTDSCLHEFCFLCLKEWSKIKPECPLCKQRFQTIIHNIRSHHEYDEYHVGSQAGTGVPFLDPQSVLLNLAFQRATVYNHPTFRPNNSYRAIVDNSLYHRAFDSMTRTPLLYIHPSSVVRAPENNNHSPTFDEDFGATISIGRARNRRDVYRHDRWVRPSLSSRIRESSPEFYRLNPATTHRLAPWLTRELNVLLDVSMDPQVYCQEILRLITMYPIRSRQFREALRPVLGVRVEHFIHEFYHFAISVHDMVSYDIVAEYEPGSRPARRFARAEPSDSDSDIEVVRVHPTAPQCTGLDLSNRAGPSNAASQPSPQVVIEINDSSSSDDEVEIISVRAATPETIIIESSESEAEITQLFSNQNCPGGCTDEPESSLRGRNNCPLGSGCESMQNMLHGIKDEIIDNYRNPSMFENGSRSPTPPMPYLRPMNLKEPSSPSTSESSPSRCSTPQPPTPTPPSSSSSSWSSSSSDSNYSPYGKRRSTYRKKKKKLSSPKHDKSRKRLRKSLFKIEESSSDEEYEPRSSRPRLRSVVVKPEPSSTRQLHRSNHYIFPTDSD